jgi:hypothetical protein
MKRRKHAIRQPNAAGAEFEKPVTVAAARAVLKKAPASASWTN